MSNYEKLAYFKESRVSDSGVEINRLPMISGEERLLTGPRSSGKPVWLSVRPVPRLIQRRLSELRG